MAKTYNILAGYKEELKNGDYNEWAKEYKKRVRSNQSIESIINVVLDFIECRIIEEAENEQYEAELSKKFIKHENEEEDYANCDGKECHEFGYGIKLD